MAQPPSPVSALVVSYHTGPVLWACLDALAANPEVGEVIVVDNGNPPEVSARLKAAAASGQLQLVCGQGNVGFGAACNLAAARATGCELLLVNPDVALAPGAVAALRVAGAGQASPTLVGGRLVDGHGIEQRGARRRELTPWSTFVSLSGLSRFERVCPLFADLHREKDPLPPGPVPMPVVSGALIWMSRADYLALGGFDEAYFLHVEDVDLCRRVRAAGGTVLFAPGAVGTHERSSSAVSSVLVARHKAKSFQTYFKKFARGPLEKAVASFCGLGLELLLTQRARLAQGKHNKTIDEMTP